MWKDAFSHTKRERRSAILLLILLFVLMAIRLFINDTSNESPQEEKERIRLEAELDSLTHSSVYSASQKNIFHSASGTQKQEIATSFPFDPNRVDSVAFVRLGIQPHIAKIILRYRSKGGQYHSAEEFSKVPFLDKETFLRLKPFIRIDAVLQVKPDTFAKKTPPFVKQQKVAQGAIFELSTVDTTALKTIPGIGSGIAHSIVAYRARLGGFYTIDQLKELKNISDEQMNNFRKFLVLGIIEIQRIDVNKASLDRLRSHPYLNFYQARAIVELRKKKGKLTSLDEFALYDEFSSKDFERLSHYLDFSR